MMDTPKSIRRELGMHRRDKSRWSKRHFEMIGVREILKYLVKKAPSFGSRCALKWAVKCVRDCDEMIRESEWCIKKTLADLKKAEKRARGG